MQAIKLTSRIRPCVRLLAGRPGDERQQVAQRGVRERDGVLAGDAVFGLGLYGGDSQECGGEGRGDLGRVSVVGGVHGRVGARVIGL